VKATDVLSSPETQKWADRALKWASGIAAAGLMFVANMLWEGYQERGRQIDSALEAIGISNIELDNLRARVDRNEARIDRIVE